MRSTVPLSRMGKEQYGEPTVPPPHTGVPGADTDASAVLVSPRTREVDPRRLLAGRVQALDRCGNGWEARRRKDIAVSRVPSVLVAAALLVLGASTPARGASDPIAGARYVGKLVYGASCKKCSSDVRLLVADDGASLLPGSSVRLTAPCRESGACPDPVRCAVPTARRERRR